MSLKQQFVHFFFFIHLVLFSFHAEDLHALLGLNPPKDMNLISEKAIKPYLLPENHELQPYLVNLFDDPEMFESLESFQAAGFMMISGHRHLMVGEYPSIDGYLFKKFSDLQPQDAQLYNYVRRIKGADVVRKYAKEHNYQHIVVPQKWLYELPKQFTKKHSEKTYLLIVEKMDLCSSAERRQLYYDMDIDMVTELTTIIHAVGGCDPFPKNQPFTRDGQIAFIDTEDVGLKKRGFKMYIIPALNEEMQAYALALWEKLEEEANKTKPAKSKSR